MSAASKTTAAITTTAATVALASPAFAAGADAGIGANRQLVHAIGLSGTVAAGLAGVILLTRVVNVYRRSVWRRNWVLRTGALNPLDRNPSWTASPLAPGQRPMAGTLARSITTF